MHCVLSFLTLNTERLLIVLGFYTLFVVDIFDICGCLSLNCIACNLACYRHKLFITVARLIYFYRVDIYAGYGNSEIFTKSFSYVVFYLVVDKSDLIFGIENDVDFVAASFVRTPEDVIGMRKFIDYNGGHEIKIISKIENNEGIDNFDEILKYSDGIMVARGDMGVEVDFERLPGLQKRFIRKCYSAGKMVITATQMLESMIEHPTPTRAEISDVANAVFDGTSAVMLSGETAVGKYPLRAVRAMAKIAEQAEDDAFEADIYKRMSYDIDYSDVTNALCDAACTTASDIKAKVIITLTTTGKSARRMSKFRPVQPVVAATPRKKTFNQLSLSWGVYPVLARLQKKSDELFIHSIDCAKQIDLVEKGDRVVITGGIPLDLSGNTNTIRVAIV